MISLSLRTAALAAVLGLSLAAQPTLFPLNGGSGIDGAFAPLANTTLDTSLQAVYEFTTLTIPAGVVVTCVGPVPITIRVQGAAVVDGILDASGVAGSQSNNGVPGGAGGLGGPGAGQGGDGGCPPANLFAGSGSPGTGRSPGQPGIDTVISGSFTDPVGGGGGGGNATAGSPGGLANSGIVGPTPHSGLGGPALAVCRAGSGGGGGGCDIDSPTVGTSNDGGGGGGGGGGRLSLFSDTSISVGPNGAIRANGGNGGASLGNGGGGGGGSGGSVELAAPTLLIDGSLSAQGGAGGVASQTNCGCSPGGAGGSGCITLWGDSSLSTGLGLAAPTPAVLPLALVVTNGTAPTGIAVGGVGGGASWAAALSLGLLPPPGINLGGGQFFQLDPFDPLLGLTFPVNQLNPIVVGLQGTGPGFIGINLAGFGLQNLDLTVNAQALQIAPTPLLASNVLPVTLRF